MENIDKINKVIQNVRQRLQYDGGDIQLVGVTPDGVVRVKLVGACAGCPMSQMTLKNGIERLLKQEVPGLTAVEAV